jgi:hypothetical protein
MNAGAAAAVGGVFFFLHADSFPPLNALGEIQRVLRDNTILGGAFKHRFAEPVWSLRLISWLNRRRYFLTATIMGTKGSSCGPVSFVQWVAIAICSWKIWILARG